MFLNCCFPLILLLSLVNVEESSGKRVIDVYSVKAVNNNNNKQIQQQKQQQIDAGDFLSSDYSYEMDDGLSSSSLSSSGHPEASSQISLNSNNGICDAINQSPFFGSFVFCCNNQLFSKPATTQLAVSYFRCCQGIGLFTDTQTMECCGKTLHDTTTELCIKDIIVPLTTYFNHLMYGPQRRLDYGPFVRTEEQPDLLQQQSRAGRKTSSFFDDSSSSVDHPAETERRHSAVSNHWDSSTWLNCSGRLVFNPEGRHASMLDCCDQVPYKRDRFYCVDGRLVEVDYHNGQWLPPVVAPHDLRPPFDIDLSFPAAQRSAMLSCSGVWYSISFTNLFMQSGEVGAEFSQRYSCCGQQVYDIYENACTDQNTLRKRAASELPAGIEPISHTLIMCGDFNALGWRPDLGYTPSITYLVDDSLPLERRPDSCCGVMLYSRARYGCSVNGLYPLVRVARSNDIVPPKCHNGYIIPVKGLSRHWHCCGSDAYNILDSKCCGGHVFSSRSAGMCCGGVFYNSAAVQGEQFECCGRNRIDTRFYYCFDSQVRRGPKRTGRR